MELCYHIYPGYLLLSLYKNLSYPDQIHSLLSVHSDGLPNIIDICGDATGTDEIVASAKYIESLGFPDVYDPDKSCTCALNATSQASHIRFTVLDFDVSPGSNPNNPSDWVEFVPSIEEWGEGRPFRRDYRGSPFLMQPSGYLNFKSDIKRQGRGFWIMFEGKSVIIDENLTKFCIKVD